MDLTWSDDEERFRHEIRTWLEANVPTEPLPSGDTEDGFRRHQEWEKVLFDARLSVVSWPEEYGGRGASLWQWLIFEEEYYRAGAPQRVSQNGIFLLAPILFEFGTEWQKERYLLPMAEGIEQWGQGWSEPNAGSDLAGIKSKADKVDGGWRVNGQKTWTTRGAFCTHLFGLFRTDPEQERHRGLSYLMVPLDADGVTVRGVGRLDGDEGFAEVFFEDVFVPDEDVLGDVDNGWGVAMATTSSERGLTLRSPGRFMAATERLRALAADQPSELDDRVADDVVQAWMDAEAYQLYTLQTVTKMLDGGSIGAESSLNKIFWSDMDVRIHETALDILGPLGELDEGGWMKGFQFSLSGPIYAGTNEIQRNVVAERVLGLPRR
jgi:alkylation response protein AidB-like acyl-CoA dehydrogenase